MTLFAKISLLISLLFASTAGGHLLCPFLLVLVLRRWLKPLPSSLRSWIKGYAVLTAIATVCINVFYFSFSSLAPALEGLAFFFGCCGVCLWTTTAPLVSAASFFSSLLLFLAGLTCPRTWAPLPHPRSSSLLVSWVSGLVALVGSLLYPTAAGVALLLLFYALSVCVTLGRPVPFRVLSIAVSAVLCGCGVYQCLHLLPGYPPPEWFDSAVNLFLWDSATGPWGILLRCTQLLCVVLLTTVSSFGPTRIESGEARGLLSSPPSSTPSSRQGRSSRRGSRGTGGGRVSRYGASAQFLLLVSCSLYLIGFPSVLAFITVPLILWCIVGNVSEVVAFIVPTTVLFGLGLVGQYCVLLPVVQRYGGRWVVVFTVNKEFSLCYLQVGVSAALFLLLGTVRSVFGFPVKGRTEAERTTGGAHDSHLPEEEGTTTESEAQAVLGNERVDAILSFAQRLEELGSVADRLSFFKQCTGYEATGAELDWLSSADTVPVRESLLRDRIRIGSSLYRHTLLLVQSFLYLLYPTVVLVALLLGGTWVRSTDLLHTTLLLLLVACFVKSDLLFRYPHLCSVSIVLVGMVLIVFNYGLQFTSNPPSCFPGTRIPLDTLGLQRLNSLWEVSIYFLLSLLLVFLHRTVNGVCLSWGALLSRKELREFYYSPSLQNWVPRMKAFLALLSSTYIAAVSFRSIFVTGFLLGTLSLLVSVAYKNATSTRLCRLVCGLYGVVVALIITVAKSSFVLPYLQTLLLHLPLCGDAEGALRCGQEIGLFSESVSEWLLPQVAPWYLTAGLVLSVYPSGAPTAVGEATFSKDAPLQRVLSILLGWGERYCGGVVIFVSHFSVFLSWLALASAPRGEVCLLHLPYLIFFLLDATPSILWPYAYAHCAAVLLYPVRWVPLLSVNFQLGERQVALSTLIGLHKYEGEVSALNVAWWPIVILLCAVIRRTLHIQRNEHLYSFISSGLLFIGFETLLLFLWMGMYYAQYSIIGVVFLGTALLLAAYGRARLLNTSGLCWLTGMLIAAVSLYLCCLAFYRLHIQAGKQHKGGGRNEWLPWLLASRDPLHTLSACCFGALCVLHSLRRTRTSVIALQDALSFFDFNGVTSLIDCIRLRLPPGESLFSLSMDRFRDVVPSIPEASTHHPYYKLSLTYTNWMAFCSPLAVVTLAAGAFLSPSVTNSLFIVVGILSVGNSEFLHSYFYQTWRPLATFYYLTPLIAVVVHLPPSHRFLAKNDDWATTLLGRDGYFFNLEKMHVLMVFLVLLQSKLYNSFVFEKVLYRKYVEASEQQKRYNGRQLRLREEEAAALHAAQEYESDLHQRISELRRMLSTANGEANNPGIRGIASPTTTEVEHTHVHWLISLVRKAAVALSHHTYEPQPLQTRIQQSTHSLSSLLKTFLYVFQKFLEHHTVALVIISALLNCVLTGCAFEMGALVFLLVIPLAYHPFAPRSSYQFLLFYITLGILLKTVVQIILVDHPPSENVAKLLSRLLVRVSSVADENEIKQTKFAFGMDYITFVSIVLHQSICVSNGVYDNNEVQRRVQWECETHGTAEAEGEDFSLRSVSPHNREGAVEDEEGEEEEDADEETSILVAAAEAKEYLTCHLRWGRALREYWKNLNTVRGVGGDRYLWYTLVNMLSVFVMVVGFGSMSGSDSVTIQENVQNNLLPAKMVLLICLSVALLLVERVLYVWRWLSVKIVLNIIVCLSYCVVYWLWRGGGPKSLFFGNLLFVLKVMEVYFSVVQVRKGFPFHRRPDPFSTRPEVIPLQWGYSVFRAIPFLWECKTVLDWTLEHTSLELNEYLRVEDIYDTVYRRQVERSHESRRRPPRSLGSPVPRRVKWTAGVSRVGLILAAVLTPLWYYSSLNPSVSGNQVVQATITLSFAGSNPFFSGTIDSSLSIPREWPLWVTKTRPTLSAYGMLQNDKKVQLDQLNTCSSEIWQVSPERFNETRKRLELVVSGQSTLSIVQEIAVERATAATSSSLGQSTTTKWEVGVDTARDLLSLLVNQTYDTPVEVPFFYTPFVFNRPSNVAPFPPSLSQANYFHCRLTLRRDSDQMLGHSVQYWCVECDPLFSGGNQPQSGSFYSEWDCLQGIASCKGFNYEEQPPSYHEKVQTPLFFVFISDDVVVGISFLNKFGLVALYTTFVLALSRLIRSMVAGKAKAVIQTDMADPLPVLQMIQCIRAAREEGDLAVEHSVYLDLIDLLRSPEKLIAVTGAKVDGYRPVVEEVPEKTRKIV